MDNLVVKKKGVIMDSDDEDDRKQPLENMFQEDEPLAQHVTNHDAKKENDRDESNILKLPSFKKAAPSLPSESPLGVSAALPPEEEDYPMPSYRKQRSVSPHGNDKHGDSNGSIHSRESSHKKDDGYYRRSSSGRRRSVSPGGRGRDDYYDEYYDSRSRRYEDDYYYDRYDYPPYDSRRPPPRGPPRGGYDRYDRYGYAAPPPRSGGRKRYEVIKGTDEDRETTTCLYVGNLPYDYKEPEVTEMFQKHGVLKSVNVPLDRHTGKNKGFAFVMFEQRDDAIKAKDDYDGLQCGNRKLRIDWDIGRERKDVVKSSRPPPPRRSRGPPPPSGGYYEDYGRGYDAYGGYHDDYREGYPGGYHGYEYGAESEYYPPPGGHDPYYQHSAADPNDSYYGQEYPASSNAGADPYYGSSATSQHGASENGTSAATYGTTSQPPSTM